MGSERSLHMEPSPLPVLKDSSSEGLAPDAPPRPAAEGMEELDRVYSGLSGAVFSKLPAEAGSVRSPQSAPVQPNRLCRRPYVNQTQPEVALLDHKCGHRTTQRPCHNLRRSWREVRCGTELFSELPDRNHPRACPSVLLAWKEPAVTP